MAMMVLKIMIDGDDYADASNYDGGDSCDDGGGGDEDDDDDDSIDMMMMMVVLVVIKAIVSTHVVTVDGGRGARNGADCEGGQETLFFILDNTYACGCDSVISRTLRLLAGLRA